MPSIATGRSTSELELAHALFPAPGWWAMISTGAGCGRRSITSRGGNGLGIRRTGARGWSIVERGEARDGGPSAQARAHAVVLVPHAGGIDASCEESLRDLELAGVRVVRRHFSSQIDQARSEMVSGALHDGCESMLSIDADIGFDPADALRLLDRPDRRSSPGSTPKRARGRRQRLP